MGEKNVQITSLGKGEHRGNVDTHNMFLKIEVTLRYDCLGGGGKAMGFALPYVLKLYSPVYDIYTLWAYWDVTQS